ncbi:hypothetical protein [Pedobacter punctiformis]|uniref:Transposase n=1 Tax=Pedobacter punctiformis TaxID=3004097 RepID=A0ABT4LAH6_9SPHI|nr:hypothetical protein [Pedobacter sp. HCMS5-2]MCZ4244932.1 hypothetical protein [Pedobacter sp. HCMS5-2]
MGTRKSKADLSSLPRHIIKQGHFFVNSHTGAKIHENRVSEWLPKPNISEEKHELIMEKRYDLRY